MRHFDSWAAGHGIAVEGEQARFAEGVNDRLHWQRIL
jgi:hypothetical protein